MAMQDAPPRHAALPSVYLQGIGVAGHGWHHWPHAAEVLRGEALFDAGLLNLPVPMALPVAERRRVGLTLKLVLAAGFEAVAAAGADAATLPTIFSASGGDGDNCHAVLETLATPERAVSPTRFHNSVHNMPAGYWSVATGCHAASTSLSAYDATFSAGLLEAAAWLAVSGGTVLLLAYDTPYPEPLHALRTIPCAFAVGMVLGAARSASTWAELRLQPSTQAPTPMHEPALERLRAQLPAARCLPLLERIARKEAGAVVIAGLDDLPIEVTLA